jgi:molybdopterin synthase catalytic subunit
MWLCQPSHVKVHALDMQQQQQQPTSDHRACAGASSSGSSSDDGRVRVEVTGEPLGLDPLLAYVSDPGAGAIATFSGVTRNSFGGKEVLRLEYEAYSPMAVRKLREVAAAAVERWPALIRVAVSHRTGVVEVAQPSVLIVASSAHRRDALEVGAHATWRR